MNKKMFATKHLKESSDATFKNLTIFKDLTKEDREERQKNVAEMKRRNDIVKSQTDPITGLPKTDKWIIQGNKLIYVDKDYNILPQPNF